jgi:hypothetical protein
MRNGIAALAAGLLLAAAGTASAQVWNEVGDAGDSIATAQVIAGSGPLTTIIGTITQDDVDIYAFEITSPTTFSATTVGGATIDTQLFLFRASGTGITFDDDDPITGVLQSRLSSTFTAALPPGQYFLAISTYDRDPHSAGLLIWNNTPFNVERAPDGPGAAGPLSGWQGSEFGTGPYTITLTGSGFTTAGTTGACCLPNGSCIQVSSAACSGSGGSYQGDGTLCGSVQCPQPPTGACCLLTGICTQMTQAACRAANGVFGGNNSACGSICPKQYVFPGPSVFIPDGIGTGCGGGSGGEVFAQVNVNDSFTIASISASFYIQHTWQGDLTIALRHVQTGTTVMMVDRPGASGITCGFGNDDYGSVQPTWFRCIDSAPNIYDTGSPGAPADNVSGYWKPENPLTPFIGQNSQGQWQLLVNDWSALDTGFINSFVLELGGPTCYPDCNGDGVLGLADFGCFQTKFALGDPYADCNGDGVLGLADFGCFQTKFALGCP